MTNSFNANLDYNHKRLKIRQDMMQWINCPKTAQERLIRGQYLYEYLCSTKYTSEQLEENFRRIKNNYTY